MAPMKGGHAREQYLAEVRKEYERAGEVGRSRLLDEAQKRTGYNRKYLIRVLNREPRPEFVKRRRKRKAEYGTAVTAALVEVWDIFEQPCGQRLAAVLREQVERLRGLGELRCSDAVAEQLQTISASTIDRLLKREKRVRMLRRNRNPNVQRLIYQKVPVKVAAEWDTSEIGNLQVDFGMGGIQIVHLETADVIRVPLRRVIGRRSHPTPTRRGSVTDGLGALLRKSATHWCLGPRC
jgi:hypothetical protein